MSIASLDSRAALIVVDVQAGTLPNARAVPEEHLVERIRALADAFRAAGRPVLFVTSMGTAAGTTEYGPGGRVWPAGFDELDPRLARTEQEPSIGRAGWSAFVPGDDTDLQAELRHRDIHQLVVVGIATTFGVESTARAGSDLGYDVVVVSDAVSDPDAAEHTRFLTRTLPALGRSATTDELIALAG